MGYKIELIKHDIIRLELIGNFTAEDTANQLSDIELIYNELDLAGKPTKFLVNAEKVGRISLETRRAFTEGNNNPQVGLSAVVGMNRMLQMVARFITVASGNNNIRFFSDEESALEWLQNND